MAVHCRPPPLTLGAARALQTHGQVKSGGTWPPSSRTSAHARTDWRRGPVGWGIYTYSITEYTSERDRTLIVQIPHLSRFPTDAGVPCGS